MKQIDKLIVFILIRLAMYGANPELGLFGLHGIPMDNSFCALVLLGRN